jgi:hypothetical protein
MEMIRNKINTRCNHIIKEGLLKELGVFIKEGGGIDTDYKDIPHPLGFKEGIKLINDYSKLKEGMKGIVTNK